MSNESEIIQAFLQLSEATDNDIVNAITAQLTELFQNPEILFLLLQIASTNDNQTVRHYSMVFARRSLYSIYTNIDNIENGELDYLLPIKDQILNMLINEPIQILKNAICDIIEIYAGIVISISTWPELSQFAMNLLQDQDQTIVALNLLYRIYMTIPDEEKNEFFIPYATLSCTSLLSDDINIRLQAIECLSDVLFENIEADESEDLDSILQIPDLMENLKSASERAIFQYQDENECSKLFGFLFESIFFDRYQQFNNYLPTFFEIVVNGIQNPEIDNSIKIKIHQLLDEGPRVDPDHFSEHLGDYIRLTLNLSASVCESDREMSDYQFNDEFLTNLSEYIPDTDTFYTTMLECIGELFERDSPPAIQVSLFSLSCIVPNCTDPILEDPDQIIDITIKGFQSEDELIIYTANELLLSLIKNSSSCLSNHIDSLVTLYLNLIPNFGLTFIQTLSVLLACADHPPSDLTSLIHLLLEFLSQPEFEFKSDVIHCISNSISHAEVDESLYQEIAPKLIELIGQDSSCFNDVFDCFGSLLVTSPNSITEDIQKIMETVFQNCTEHSGCATTLLAFVENLPVSMEPFNESVIQFCQMILSKDSNEFISNNELDDDFGSTIDEIVKQTGSAIKMLAYLMPDQEYIEKARKMVKSISPVEQMSAAESVVISAQSLFVGKCDPSKLLETLFKQLYDQDSSEVASEMINAIDALISSYPSHYITENTVMFSELIFSILNGQFKCSNSQSNQEQIIPSLYLLFSHFIESVGENFLQQVPPFQEKLFDMSKGQHRNLRGYATMMLAKIAVVLQIPDILQICFSSISMNVKLKHVFLRINVFNAFRIVLRSVSSWNENEQFSKMANDIQNSVHEILIPILSSVVSGNSEAKELFESAAALWARCVIVFEWKDLEPKDIESVLSKIDVLFENDNGKVLDYAELLMGFVGDDETWNSVGSVAPNLAIRIFAQNQWYFVRTPDEVLEFFKNVLSQCEDVNKLILEKVHYNERVLKTITDRLS